MLSVEISLRREDGMRRAYVWLSDGRVVGYRDLDQVRDVLHLPEFGEVYRASLREWHFTYGVRYPGVCEPPPLPVEPSGRGLWGRWRHRRFRLKRDRMIAKEYAWLLERPEWMIPTEPPRGGWHDLVRHDAGSGLWREVELRTPDRSRAGSGAWRGRWRGEAHAWRVGAWGEETVGGELRKLARRTGGAWRYVHSVPVGSRGADVDHVLVGPGGVFTINTKAHIGGSVWVAGHTFIVNNHKQPYLRNARYEAECAARLIGRVTRRPVGVRALIVVVDPRSFVVKADPPGVGVLTQHRLVEWLLAQPHVLSPQEVDDLFAVIRRSTTWSTMNVR